MTTEAECIAALRRAADRLGESPTKAQYEDLGLTPASATIVRTIGGWNAAKERAGLETAPSTGSRTAPKPDHVDLPEDEDWEALTVDQRWHYRNAAWNTERTLRRRARLRSWLEDRKVERGCARCGVGVAACLDFHHVDGEKVMNVGKMVTYGYGTDTLREEIEKCTVLCANCHRKRHHDAPTRDLRRWVHERKRASGGCARCEEDDLISLDFHHVDGEKEATVSELVSNGRPKRDVRAEIEKCTVLCANCHRLEHYQPPSIGSENDSV